MNNITEFITNLFFTNGIIIAVAAYVVGEIIKAWVPNTALQNRFIPAVGGALGILLGVLGPHLFVDADPVTAAIMGLALGWAATGGYETFRNIVKKS